MRAVRDVLGRVIRGCWSSFLPFPSFTALFTLIAGIMVHPRPVLSQVMRDATKAHRSLYMVGNILHRDVSSNNIIITNPEVADGFHGMLIDLDLAKERDSGPSGARHQTGTLQFMAVEVLRRVDHTYRHDLESFFYVLLWMCARQSWRNGFAKQEKPPQESRLRKWGMGTFQDIAVRLWMIWRWNQ